MVTKQKLRSFGDRLRDGDCLSDGDHGMMATVLGMMTVIEMVISKGMATGIGRMAVQGW